MHQVTMIYLQIGRKERCIGFLMRAAGTSGLVNGLEEAGATLFV